MKQPTVFEINTQIFINEVAARTGAPANLSNVPDEIWDEVAQHGQDTVWFMGVWKRSAVARDMARHEGWLRESFNGVGDADIVGSAYSIQDYIVDESLGGNEGLAIARAKLKERGINLILDYVPNHVAIDHPWAREHPEYLVGGTSEELHAYPDNFIETPGGIIARGKDPNFAPWSDVLQINAFSEPLRRAVTDLLKDIASMCDGVRCDMAMLLMNDIFHKTWGKRVGEVPSKEYWPAIVNEVKAQYPDFIFLAEVYWGKEQALIEQGFDFCYDKDLYDELINGSVHTIKKCLAKPLEVQQHFMRFIENHDEDRAARVFSFEKHQAAAVIAATLPGMRLFHDGQFEGRQEKLPVHLGRRQFEVTNEIIQSFYDGLHSFIKTIDFEKDSWQLLEAQAGLLRQESKHIIAWAWSREDEKKIIAVNYSAVAASAKLPILNDNKRARSFDIYGNAGEMVDGATIMLLPWQVVIVNLQN